VTRQQILHMWLGGPALDLHCVAWSFFDATDGAGPALPDDDPPYATGLDAMRDGWMLISITAPAPTNPDPHAPPGYLDNEFVFERRIDG